MLEVKLDWIISPTTISVKDITGDYHVSSNPGGYGAPNDLFTDFAHYVIMRKKGVGATADVVLVVAANDPLTNLVFTAPRLTDGWYEAVKLNIRKWLAGTYDAGTVRYYNGAIYVAQVNTSSTPGANADWAIETDLLEIEENETIVITIAGKSTPYNGDVYYSKQIAANSMKGKCGICTDDRQKERIDTIFLHIQAVLVADSQGNFADGEWNALSLIQMGAK
jgi:hypothetical protein